MRLWAVRAFLVFSFALLSACVAYDHRWVQNHQEKQRAVKRLEPAKLERSKQASLPRRTAHVRGYATRAHAAETLDWGRQFEELLRDANAILEPALGLHLESSGVSLWQPAAPEDRLEAVLDELAQHDRADSVDWVVGFVKSTPELVFDHHHLGVGRLLSKYLVMRASNNPGELELLSREYYDLSDAEKGKLHTERKRHRWLVVFLHELGHTLGARHRVEAGSIMSPAYDPEHRAFDGTTLGLFGITVGKDLGSPSVETYRAVHDYYEAHRAGWVPSEREDTLAWLARLARSGRTDSAGNARSPAAPAQVAKDAPDPVETSPLPLTTLSAADRLRYDDALKAETRGQFRAAWQALLPIVETHRRVLEVQDLRCRLARKQRFFASVEEAHCEPAVRLQSDASQ